MNACFAFCDIRSFTATTEVLQENVLRFVNLVGHIVHSQTMRYGGFPNKNIGDGFLLVWKAPSNGGSSSMHPDQESFPGFRSVKDSMEAATLADCALKAMVQTAFDLHHINTVPTWELRRQLVCLDLLRPDYDTTLSQADEKVGSMFLFVKLRNMKGDAI